MNILFSQLGNSELFFVYGLIALVIILILLIIIIDRNESKRKQPNLFDTLNMKIIATNEELEQEKSKLKEEDVSIDDNRQLNNKPIETIEILNDSGITDNEDTEYSDLRQKLFEIDSEGNVEQDLDKTQAQIRVEEITNALKNAMLEEKDKYQVFEEEQEKSAIISYEQLKDSYDKLYEENEKTQYLDDETIPINIEELYQLNDKEEKKKNEKEELTSNTKDNQNSFTFKRSPYISPVYGIQKPPVEETKTNNDIDDGNDFLNRLKELKNNLD